MLKEKEIIAIAQRIIRANKAPIKIKFLSYNKFKVEAKKSPMVKQVLREGNAFYDLNVPSLFSHKKDTIYFNKKMLTKLVNGESILTQRMFIKAITYHELSHFMNKTRMKDNTVAAAMLSEDRAEKQFKKSYPKLAALGKKIASKYGDN